MSTQSISLKETIRTIGIDFDDVLHDFIVSLHAYHNKKYGTKVKRSDVISYDIEKAWGCSKEEAIEKVFEFYRTQEHHDTLPLEGAREIVTQLSRKYSLHIITSRATEIEGLTRAWIDTYFPSQFQSIQFTGLYGGTGATRGKPAVCAELSVDLMIEDSMAHARDISACGIPVLLIDSPWNQGELPAGAQRVYSWKEIGTILLG